MPSAEQENNCQSFVDATAEAITGVPNAATHQILLEALAMGGPAAAAVVGVGVGAWSSKTRNAIEEATTYAFAFLTLEKFH